MALGASYTPVRVNPHIYPIPALLSCAMKKSIKVALLAPACIALTGLLAQSLSAAPILANISLNIGIDAGPPPAPREVMVASPGPGYVWLGGYWDGQPGHYQWNRGHWDRPPQGRTRWNAPHWDKDRDGHYHKTEGSWR